MKLRGVVLQRGSVALLLLLAGAFPLSAQGQDREEPLSTDRPGFGIGTAAVSRFQTEGGYSYAEQDGVESSNVGELLLRFPLGSALELRIAPNSYVVQRGPDGDESGFQDAAVGAKVTLAKGAEDFDLLRPAIAVLLNTTIPTGDDAFGAESLQPQALLALGWTLGGGAELGGDVNVTSLDTGQGRAVEVAGGATLSYSLGERLGSYAELYGFAPEDDQNAGYFDAGLTLLLSNDFQLDVSGGIGLTDAAQDFFVGFGASRRW